jgi:hypothetical protein
MSLERVSSRWTTLLLFPGGAKHRGPGWLTFDGIHATSGVQVLGPRLAGIALIVHDRVGFIRAVLV